MKKVVSLASMLALIAGMSTFEPTAAEARHRGGRVAAGIAAGILGSIALGGIGYRHYYGDGYYGRSYDDDDYYRGSYPYYYGSNYGYGYGYGNGWRGHRHHHRHHSHRHNW
jgi:hypothetical protein